MGAAGASTSTGCAATARLSGCRASTSRRRSGRPCSGPERALRHAAVERAQGGPRPARSGRQGALLAAARFRGASCERVPTRTRCASTTARCSSRRTRAVGPARRTPTQADFPPEKAAYALRDSAFFERQAAAARRADRPLRRAAARRPAAVDADAAGLRAARPRAPLRRRARRGGLRARARRRHGRRPSPAPPAGDAAAARSQQPPPTRRPDRSLPASRRAVPLSRSIRAYVPRKENPHEPLIRSRPIYEPCCGG